VEIPAKWFQYFDTDEIVVSGVGMQAEMLSVSDSFSAMVENQWEGLWFLTNWAREGAGISARRFMDLAKERTGTI
jgi:hypothetical protein